MLLDKLRRCKKIIRNRVNEKITKRIVEDAVFRGVEFDLDTAYKSMYQDNKDYSLFETDIRTVAFYLPQFHCFPENDSWWGKGFTEWTNTESAYPRFDGHYQPRKPHGDIGYYDLSQEEAIAKQVMLAKEHQVYGFCFYYYWFSGKKLMQKPIEIFYQHKEWNLNFCLCWANESFTRAWDGSEKDIIMKQKYDEKDPYLIIRDLKRYMLDDRYIRKNGKPVLLIYNMGDIPRLKGTIRAWRKEAREQGIGEICIWMCRTNGNTANILGVEKEVDAEVEFPPHNMWWPSIRENKLQIPNANIFHYHKLVEVMISHLRQDSHKRRTPLFRTCMLGWDNSSRRKEGWTLYYGFSIEFFALWLKEAVAYLRKTFPEEERYLFINAWNEWAEGTYLEPDQKFGYANINALSEQIVKGSKGT